MKGSLYHGVGWVLLAAGLMPGTSCAQVSVGFPPRPIIVPWARGIDRQEGRNVLKIDALAPVPWALVSLLNNRARYFPVIVAYERSLRPRVSVGVEAQAGGIAPSTRRSGVTLEGRYYLTLPDGPHWLAGLYAAPRLRYLTTRYDTYPQPGTIRGYWGGAEVLVGQRWPSPGLLLPGLILDAGTGMCYWTRLRPDSPASSPEDRPTMQPGWQLTVRLGVGYRF